MRDGHLVDVPQLGQLADVVRVLPVAHAREVTVGAGLACVLGGRLTVHLEYPGAGAAEHAAEKVEIVHEASGRRGLVRLVEALQHRRQQAVTRTDALGGRGDRFLWDVADLGHPVWGVPRDGGGELLETDRVGGDVLLVVPAATQDLAEQSIEQRDVGSESRGQVEIRLPGDRCAPWVHREHSGGRGPRRRSSIRAHSTVCVSATL